MIHIRCEKCEQEFCVEDVVTRRGYVVVEFHCPYCDKAYHIKDQVQLVGMSGGVNISGGSHIDVGGDIAGRDIRK